jgi:hypothetical protein
MALPTAGAAETRAATSRRRVADAERRHAGWVAGKATEAAADRVLGPAAVAARVLGCPKARVEAAEVCAAMSSRQWDGGRAGQREWLLGTWLLVSGLIPVDLYG